MKYPERIDLHMHSVISDGTETLAEIIDDVKEAGIGLFSLTDHDAIKGCAILPKLLKEGDPQFITGVELGCRDEEGQYHILGYGYNTNSAAMQGLVEKTHRIRMNKVHTRLDLLESQCGIVFPEEEVRDLLALDNPGKPHIANLLVKHGYAENIQEAMKEYLNKLRVKLGIIRPEEAIACILAGGGIPVLAHPTYGNGDQLIMGEEMDRRLRRLKGFGLRGIEAYYSGFTARITRELMDFADKYDLLVTAGSDFHGRNKLVQMGDTGLEPGDEFPERLCRFLDEVTAG